MKILAQLVGKLGNHKFGHELEDPKVEVNFNPHPPD